MQRKSILHRVHVPAASCRTASSNKSGVQWVRKYGIGKLANGIGKVHSPDSDVVVARLPLV